MSIALVCPDGSAAEALELKQRLARFAAVELFDLNPGETLIDAFADVQSCQQAIFLCTPDATPRPAREAWGGILEHIETNHEPPLAFYLLEPVPVPAPVRRAGCLRTPRELDAWIAAQLPLPGHVPAPLPWFAGRDAELHHLFLHLVDQPGLLTLTGPALCGKTTLAQHFAHLAAPCFQSVEWIFDGRALPASAISHRTLFVIDDAREPYPIPAGQSSVLLTAREWNSGPTLPLAPVPLPDLTAHPDLSALALLRRNGFHRTVADLPAERLQALAAARQIDPIDAAGDWFRLPWPVPPDESWRPRWARAVHHGILPTHARHAWLPEALAAYQWAAVHDWKLAADLGRRAASILEQEGRRDESAHLWLLLERDADAHGQPQLAAEAASARAWILNEHTGSYRNISPGGQLSLFT